MIYSLIRIKDEGVPQELYFRILEGEQSFWELAREYSEGVEAQTNGLLGPVELGKVFRDLAQILLVSQIGQLWAPIRLGEWRVIVRLEKRIPAQLDESMRRRLLDELFQVWLQEELAKLANSGLISLN
ncbi:peptidylprolyl isomerase [Kamptonema formosum]|uniref:peptidylprolyl isomerase n=1 Tax=Kamptonema formosum TaxID=331992 RepID=UPI0003486A3D